MSSPRLRQILQLEEDRTMRVFVTKASVFIDRENRLVGLAIETKQRNDEEEPSRFLCGLTNEQAITIADFLEVAVKDNRRTHLPEGEDYKVVELWNEVKISDRLTTRIFPTE